MATDSHPNPTHAPLSEETVALRYSMANDETASEAVYRAVARVEGCSALELAPIGETIDSDSLDALFSPANRDNGHRLTFQYAGYDVVVTGDEITVLSVS